MLIKSRSAEHVIQQAEETCIFTTLGRHKKWCFEGTAIYSLWALFGLLGHNICRSDLTS